MIGRIIGWVLIFIIGIFILLLLLPFILLFLVVMFIGSLLGFVKQSTFRVWTNKAKTGASSLGTSVKNSVKDKKPFSRHHTVVDATVRDIKD